MPCERGTLVPGSDGLPARCVGPWSADKLYYVRGYLELFARAMQRKFGVRHYVDLFAGPGRCVFDDDSGETDGSPLLALKIEPQFTRFHFVDADPAALAALRTRLAQVGGKPPLVQTYEADANAVVRDLSRAIPADRALSVAVIDPTGLDLTFEALRTLTRGQRMDLIYVFPEGMAAKRNLERFLRRPESRLDRALGTDAWRGVVRGRMLDPADPEAQWEQVGRPLVDILREQLVTLDYQDIRLGSEIIGVRNRRNVPLYYLVFASKNPLGHRFWQAISRYDPSGQASLL